MAKQSRSMSHIMEQLSNNCIFETWTGQWGLKVYPAYQIDKLKFSFIDKGSSGKGKSFDIYMECRKADAACFDNWAYDIQHARLERILAAEKQAGEKYPKTYAYSTGENAEKHIGICNSTKGGYCINASITINNEKRYCNIPITFHSLRYLAQMFADTYKYRKMELLDVWKEAYDKNRNYQKDDADNVTQSQGTQTSEQTSQTSDRTKQEKSSDVTAADFHHGNLKAEQFHKISDTLSCVKCTDGTILYLTWEKADAKSDKTIFEKFIDRCISLKEPESPHLKRPVDFKAMYLTQNDKNYFYRFS